MEFGFGTLLFYGNLQSNLIHLTKMEGVSVCLSVCLSVLPVPREVVWMKAVSSNTGSEQSACSEQAHFERALH